MDQAKRDASIHVESELSVGHDLHAGMKRSRTEDHAASGPEDIVVKNGIKKDRAIANYYRRLTINNDIQFYHDILVVENLGEAMKRNIKNKLHILLNKKIDDKYDDVV